MTTSEKKPKPFGFGKIHADPNEKHYLFTKVVAAAASQTEGLPFCWLIDSCSSGEKHDNIEWCFSKYTLPSASSNILPSAKCSPSHPAAIDVCISVFQHFLLFFFKTLPDDYVRCSLILVSMLFMVLTAPLTSGITLASFKVTSHSLFI